MSSDSKFLSRILRHEPELIDVRIDRRGWVQVDELLLKLKKAGRGLTKAQLLKIIETNDKRRFTLSPDGRRLRAAQGHSIDVDLDLSPVTPPDTLYHGTASQSLDAIFETGLNPGRRHQVHLSPDPETAMRVGQRHGKPTVLRVGAAAMHAAGHAFYRTDNGVWLTDSVPPPYLGFGIVS
ncbi:putative RNA 2'-phosphotransferase [Roseobacter fucihabitans]|uniref:Probable RNA 2'-phosphotransferase n=1 Tax=Roseobacter fucihabitans TaxID=1537242 RepID=A0ABZ2BML2_9RHOB|nr:RNA 2'-phosphotransferase [Roseobacter litoralis]MBC6963628.1 RNA 2'-phosphotransferase [Roseobacter litoralis]